MNFLLIKKNSIKGSSTYITYYIRNNHNNFKIITWKEKI